MERTSIFAHSNKLIFNAQSQNNCPNCAHYQLENQAIKKKLSQKFQQIEASRPAILEILQSQNIVKYQQELKRLKQSYESLRKKLVLLDKQNEQLLEENQKTINENKKLTIQLNQSHKQNDRLKSQHLAQMAKKLQKQDRKSQKLQKLADKSILSEISTNLLDKSSITMKSNEDTLYLEGLIKRRYRIQQRRHTQIERLGQLLAQF